MFDVKKLVDILCLLTLLVGLAACDEYPVESVVLNPTSLSLNVGEQDTIEVRIYPLSSAYANTVKWQSSDESVAVVSAKGVVTAVYSGKCTITATAGKQSATCEVVVNDLEYGLISTSSFRTKTSLGRPKYDGLQVVPSIHHVPPSGYARASGPGRNCVVPSEVTG